MGCFFGVTSQVWLRANLSFPKRAFKCVLKIEISRPVWLREKGYWSVFVLVIRFLAVVLMHAASLAGGGGGGGGDAS